MISETIPGISRLYLDKESPLRLVSGGQFQTHPSFEMLVCSLLRRVHLLSAFYCDGPDYVDFSDLIALSKEVKVVNASVHWQQQMRFSYRQEKNVSMGGVSGWIEIKGDIEKFIPYLKIGEYLHVGKGTGLGLGKIKIENMRE